MRDDRRVLLLAEPFVIVDDGVTVMSSFVGHPSGDRGSDVRHYSTVSRRLA
jgi:hypothetical protein